jgi:hypothetical protein
MCKAKTTTKVQGQNLTSYEPCRPYHLQTFFLLQNQIQEVHYRFV